MKSLNPFPIIHKSKYDFKFEDLRPKVEGYLQAAKEYIEEHNLTTPEKDGGVTTVPISKGIPPHVWDEFEDFRPWLYERVNRVWDLWRLQPMNKHLSDSWINMHPPGAYTSEHHHQNVTVAVACYLHVPENSGRLMIKNPYHIYKLGDPVHEHYYAEGMDWEYIDVKTGDVLFFPGWLTHKTERNNSEEDRYIMSLNIMGRYVN
jgi:uncharacterized protein (TIGR02466 family)